MNLLLLDPRLLRPHEETDTVRLRKVRQAIDEEGVLRFPIVADKQTLTILDGHHRVEALKSLGCRFVPVQLLDYGDPAITVESRRKGLRVSKEKVRSSGLSGRLFPSRTTRHAYSKVREPTPLTALR